MWTCKGWRHFSALICLCYCTCNISCYESSSEIYSMEIKISLSLSFPGSLTLCLCFCFCLFFLPLYVETLGPGGGVHVAGFDKVRDPRLPASANRQHLSPTHLLFTFSFVTFFPHQVPAGCINYLWEKDQLIHCWNMGLRNEKMWQPKRFTLM